MKNKKLIIANWKMNPQTLKEAEALFNSVLNNASGYKNINIAVCPPFVYLELIQKLLKIGSYKLKVKLGAQDLFWENSGAYTGEISPRMLKNIGAEYAIIGHSERRWFLEENNEVVVKKLRAALDGGLKVILCVGEKERDDNYHKFVADQVNDVIKNVSVVKIKNLIIAYEPIWAIGSGISDNPKESAEMIMYIRKIVADKYNLKTAMNMKILYGGSVDSKNVKGFLKEDGIDGALVGGASLKAREFVKMLKIANNLKI